MIEIKTLKNTAFNVLYQSFANAFGDYDAPPFDEDEIKVMLERRGYSAEHSLGAFDGDKLVSFTFNGIGTYLGKRTAYDTGTGTIKEYRGQKLAGKIFEETVPVLKEKGIEQYILEVLQHNTPAFNIYKNQGFTILREFNYYNCEQKNIVEKQYSLPENYTMKEIAIPKESEIEHFQDFKPSWQNSLDSINRNPKSFKTLGVFHNSQLVAYGIFDPNSGDIPQLAVDKGHRRKKLATAIFYSLIGLNKHHLVRIINTEKGYLPMEAFFDSLGISTTGYQYEMIKEFV